MNRFSPRLFVLFGAFVAACSSDPASKKAVSPGATAGASGAGASGAVAGVGGTSAGGTSAGGTSAGGTSAGGTSAGGTSETAEGGSLPVAPLVSCDGMTASGTLGVWQDVTPSGISLDPSLFNNGNFGLQDVLSDPVASCVMWAFTTYQGVWRSNDYGATWQPISAHGGPLDDGRAWGEAIDPNPMRDPKVPPVMYAPQGYGPAGGIMKSVDGGVTWVQTYTDPGGYGADIYTVEIDPTNSQHVIASFHSAPNGHGNALVESKDAGATWKALPAIGNASDSLYVHFVTGSVWLAISSWNNNTNGTWRTADSGATWAMVSNNEHLHGCNQAYIAGDGVVYLPGQVGIERSTDNGMTWTLPTTQSENSVVATAKYLYASNAWATGDGFPPSLMRADKNGMTWAPYGDTPSAMTNGAKRAAVGFDGTHYVIVQGSWDAGIWRYVEP
jgi:hypothetical protein